MARARSPDSIKAEQMYKAGTKLVDIAKKLGVPDGTVRRWKSTQHWDDERNTLTKEKSERSGSAKTNVRKKRGGAPQGNKNAAGHHKSVPLKKGDRIALKHGGYSAVYWDTIDEAEQELSADMPEDEEKLILDQIRLFSIRERRIMQAINRYRNMTEPVAISGTIKSEDKRAFPGTKDKAEQDRRLYEERIEEKVQKNERLPGEHYSIMTQTENKDNVIARLEKELSTVQSKKTRAIDTLVRLRLEKRKIEGESRGNELVRLWAERVKKTEEKQDE